MAQADFLTQQNLDSFKALYPQDTRLQSLTLSELMANTQDVTPQAMLQAPVEIFAIALPPAVSCAIAVGTVVIDALCLITGAVALRNTIVKTGAQAVGNVVAPIMSKLEGIIAKMAASNATVLDIATGLGRLLLEIKDASLFDAVWDAFKQELTWYYAVLYGVIALATIVALLATEGLAIIAEIVLLLASFVTMVIDIVTAVTTCAVVVAALTAHAPPAPPAPGNPYVTEPHGGFVTSGGYYLTFIGGGGLSNATAALNTNATAIGATEAFQLIPVDPNVYSFAIQFPNVANTFLTAVNGGGVSSDPPTTYPIQTYSKTLGPNETVALVQLPDGNFAICLPTGNYVSVGNLSNPLSGPVAALVTQTPGAFETFTFKKTMAAG